MMNMDSNNENLLSNNNSEVVNRSLGSTSGNMMLPSILASAFDTQNEVTQTQPKHPVTNIVSKDADMSDLEVHSGNFVSLSNINAFNMDMDKSNQEIIKTDECSVMGIPAIRTDGKQHIIDSHQHQLGTIKSHNQQSLAAETYHNQLKTTQNHQNEPFITEGCYNQSIKVDSHQGHPIREESLCNQPIRAENHHNPPVEIDVKNNQPIRTENHHNQSFGANSHHGQLVGIDRHHSQSIQYSNIKMTNYIDTIPYAPQTTYIANSVTCKNSVTQPPIDNKPLIPESYSGNDFYTKEQPFLEKVQHSTSEHIMSKQLSMAQAWTENQNLESDREIKKSHHVKTDIHVDDCGQCTENADAESERRFRCGGCMKEFVTICKLHQHLQLHITGGSYHYDHNTHTAFPKYETTCSSSQTDSKVVNVLKVNKETYDLKCLTGIKRKRTDKYEIHSDGEEDVNKEIYSDEQKKLENKSAEITLKEEKIPYRNRNGKFIKKNPNKLTQAIEVKRQLRDAKREKEVKKMEKVKSVSRPVRTIKITFPPPPEQKSKSNFKGLDAEYDNDINDGHYIPEAKSESKSTMTKKSKRLFKKQKKKGSKLKTIEKQTANVDKDEDIHVKTEPISLEENTDNAYELSTQYMCPNCKISFSSDAFLSNHMLRHQGQYPCDICFASFQTFEQLTSHICKDGNTFELTSVDIQYCHYCEKVFTELIGMRGHVCVSMGTDNKEEQVIRPFPDKTTDVNALMKYLPDVKTEQPKYEVEETVKCKSCGKVFENSCLLYTHSFIHRCPYKCSNCEMRFFTESNQIDHEIICIIGKRYPCHICKKSFTSQSYLQCHIQLHQGVKNYQCDKCGQAFVRGTYLKRHIQYCMNPGERKKDFECDICEKKFYDRHTLAGHRTIVHSDLRAFVCEVCGATFKYANALKKHSRIHMVERPVLHCDKCDATFHASEGLKRHQKRHSQQCKEQCNICGKSFHEKWNLKAHMRQHTGEKPYICDICGQGFAHNVSRKNHMQNHHGINKM